jgi:hypothetical protein
MKRNFLFFVFSLIIGCGIVLAVYQYVYNRSLWHDEAVLSLNIINRDFHGLTKPLDFAQVAPIGFLWVTKIFVLIFGDNEYALRLFPLISFLTAIPLFYLLVERLAKDKLIALLSTSIFCITKNLLVYSSEVKSYSVDVLVTVLILYLSFSLSFRKGGSLAIYAVAGGMAVWFSTAAIIILSVCGLYLLYQETYRKKNWGMLIPFMAWMVSFSIYFVEFIYRHPNRKYQITDFQQSFMPLNPLSGEFYGFLLNAVKEMHVNLGFGRFWPIPFALSLIGVAYLIRNRCFRTLYFFLAPITVHLAMSGLKMYPFIGRLILYTTPMTILVFSIGIYAAFDVFQTQLIKLPLSALIVPVLVMFYPLARDFPIENQEIKKSLSFVKKHSRSDVPIYVYYGSYPAFTYYKDKMGILNPIIFGTLTPGQSGIHEEDLNNLRGKVYLLFSHVYPFTPEDNEELYAVNFLLNNGAELLDTRKFRGSSVYVFDIKSPSADFSGNMTEPARGIEPPTY